jgi:hypothetical protein
MWQQYTNAVLGLCVIVVAFIGTTLATTTSAWTFGILVLAVVILALWGAGSAMPSMTSEQRKHA